MNLACRLCRTSINAARGCAVCDEWRKNMVATDELEDEKPSLSDVGSEVVAELRYALRQAKAVHRDESADAKDRLMATSLILKVGNTAAKVLEAARKLQTDGLAAIRNMSFLERAELFITWYAALPPPYREQVRLKQTEFEAKVQLALPEKTP